MQNPQTTRRRRAQAEPQQVEKPAAVKKRQKRRMIGNAMAMVIFAAISLAIIIPTPNGAGPWHFVVISMLTLYGVSQVNASSFALIVHTFQTLGVMLLGAYGWVSLQIRNKKKLAINN